MNHAIIVAHPRHESFTLTMARAYAAEVEAAGDRTVMRDLYRMEFDPCLHASELADHEGFAPRADVAAERLTLKEIDVFVLVYPLWFNAAPAMLKGYVDRVFGMGFGYSPHSDGGNHPLLSGRRLVSFSSSGAPQHWVEATGAWSAMVHHFDDHLSAMTGMELIGHHNIGGIVPGIRPDVVERHLAEVRRHAGAVSRAYR